MSAADDPAAPPRGNASGVRGPVEDDVCPFCGLVLREQDDVISVGDVLFHRPCVEPAWHPPGSTARRDQIEALNQYQDFQ